MVILKEILRIHRPIKIVEFVHYLWLIVVNRDVFNAVNGFDFVYDIRNQNRVIGNQNSTGLRDDIRFGNALFLTNCFDRIYDVIGKFL